MKLINPSMKVSEAARLAASMNARLMARPGRLEIENLPDLESSRFERCECVSHGAGIACAYEPVQMRFKWACSVFLKRQSHRQPARIRRVPRAPGATRGAS